MKFVCALILVENIERSREFYEKTLKQKVKYDFGENVIFEGDFAIHLKSHFEKLAKVHKSSLGSNSFELYFETDKLGEIHDELKKVRVEFLHELEEEPWGQRVFRIYDPDKHLVEIGEAIDAVVIRLLKDGYSIDEIVAKTGMPEGFVEVITKNNH